MNDAVTLRRGRADDATTIQHLYRSVARIPGGIARTPEEVTKSYVEDFVAHSLERGILLVAEIEGVAGLAAELHAYRSDLRAFAHVLGDLTVAVHPDAQGHGLGRKLFVALLDTVAREHPDITRVELVAQESNRRALHLYESLGFQREGRLEGRILSPGGGTEADIPLAWLRR